MQRLWLIFAQAVTISVAVLFVLGVLKPEWLTSNPAAVVTIREVAANPAQTSPTRPPNAAPSYARAADQALPSVVHIYTRQIARVPRHPLMNDPVFQHFFGTPERSGLGSGVIVGAEGYVLTNNHVIENADEIEVALTDGRKFNATVLGHDPETDLAVLKLDNDSALPAIAFAPADSLAVGDVVLAIGNPFGVGQTVTMGIASALERNHLGINTFENFIQTDAAINPGNSGGALVDASGHLVGINTAIFTRSGSSSGVGFAIPVSIARKVLEQIIAHGEVVRGWIGVEMRDASIDLVNQTANPFGTPGSGGALINAVFPGGPAARSGIRPGDVLIAVDGQAVSNTRTMLDLIAALPPGRSALLRVQRGDAEIELTITVGRRPPNLASQGRNGKWPQR
ncbi:DegQ protease [Betaproteobacteria bacterium]|nr:DegQ protease [Betaproteobacteria bacterium]GHU23270.1 DegQ protease [Betaproteobacteria bacterium]GHU28051.1 DegQ protease [Betaproteobacteria bacterium]